MEEHPKGRTDTMKTVTIGFSNMWGKAEDFTAEYMYRCFPLLRGHYDLQVKHASDAAYVFYSVYGYVQNPGTWPCIRILISGEAGDHFEEGGKIAPGVCQRSFYHYGLTCAADNQHPNHIFFPQPLLMLNLYNDGWQSLIRKPNDPWVEHKKYFCNFIYGNPYSLDRIDFMKMLSKYKRVECAGLVEGNNYALRGLPSYDKEGYGYKQVFQSMCKFSIAFENNYFPGYTTEKLSDPLVARSLPIYFGNPKVAEIFNPESYINVADFDSWERAIDYIKEVDQNPKMYEYYLNQPPFKNNEIPEKFSDSTYLAFFKRIFG